MLVGSLVEKLGNSNDLFFKLQSAAFWLNCGKLPQANSAIQRLIKFSAADENTKITILSFLRMALDQFSIPILSSNYRSFFIIRSESGIIKKLKMKLLSKIMDKDSMQAITAESLYQSKQEPHLLVYCARILLKAVLITSGLDKEWTKRLLGLLANDCSLDSVVYFIAKDVSNAKERLASLELLNQLRCQLSRTSQAKPRLELLKAYHSYSSMIPIAFLSLLRELYIAYESSFEELVGFMDIHLQFIHDQYKLNCQENSTWSIAQLMLVTVAESPATKKALQTIAQDNDRVEKWIEQIRDIALSNTNPRPSTNNSQIIPGDSYLDPRLIFCSGKERRMLSRQQIHSTKQINISTPPRQETIPEQMQTAELPPDNASNELFEQDLSFPSEKSPEFKSVDFSAEDDHLNRSAEHYLDDFLRRDIK
jgi:hypothetical protein